MEGRLDMAAPERTLVLLKPDALARGLAGRILQRFEDAGLKIVGKTYPNESLPGTIRGDFAHISKAYAEAKHEAVANLVHASGNVEEAKYEVELWFDPSELFEYKTLAERFAF